MTQQQNKRPAAARIQSSLRRQRRILLIAVIVTVALAVGLALTTFFTGREPFYDPADDTKYYVVQRDGAFVMIDKDGELLRKTEGANFVTAAGTIVNVDKKTGECTVVAKVLVEGEETSKFNSGSNTYDVLLFPILERADISGIEIVNKSGTISIGKIVSKDGVECFVLKNRPDLEIGSSLLFATLINCTGYTQTLMRLDQEKVDQLGYAEYGLDKEDVYFVITDMKGKSHKVIIGDEIPSGAGYYARYNGRNAVYVLREFSGETEYNSTFEKCLLTSTEEDYVVAPGSSHNVTSSNYVDVTGFKIYNSENRGKPFVEFSYSGSIDKRRNTYYSNIPYVADGGMKGYTINSITVDDCLYSLYELKPDHVVALGDNDRTESLNEWLKPYGLDVDSYAYRICYTLNLARTYDSTTGKDVISKETGQEYHEILISKKQDNGFYYMYNICYNWDPETSSFSKMAVGYDMVVAVTAKQIQFLTWDFDQWINTTIFSGHISYIKEVAISIKPGDSIFPTGLNKVLYLDNSESLVKEPSNTAGVPTNKLVVRDNNGIVVDTEQFRSFYLTLLYTGLADYSSLSEAEKEAYRASGAEGAYMSIKMTYELFEYDYDKKDYIPTGEVIVKEYCFYKSARYPREVYTTQNGIGDFYIVRSRIDKVISDLNRLYTGETIVPDAPF
ncbi:MAG: DUF4340 domain-containing protein [Clostridia bacterium]|nr:DUF4340 domain-containing protein [Clostridia bacterium]